MIWKWGVWSIHWKIKTFKHCISFVHLWSCVGTRARVYVWRSEDSLEKFSFFPPCGSSVGKVVHESIRIWIWSPAPTQKPSVVAHVCNPSTEEMETGASLGLGSQPASHLIIELSSVRGPVFKNKVERYRGGPLCCALAAICTCTEHVYLHTHIYSHGHTKGGESHWLS